MEKPEVKLMLEPEALAIILQDVQRGCTLVLTDGKKSVEVSIPEKVQ